MSKLTLKQAKNRQQQGYDRDPPRCFTCVYFQQRFQRRPAMPHAAIERCTFGDFPTTHKAVCDEWHSREGEVVA